MINKLDLKVGYKTGRSYLRDTYFTRPFKIANVGEQLHDEALHLVIMSSSPGILDNDCYDMRIEVDTNARLKLQSQSYQRLFAMEHGASQRMEMRLHPYSEISYIQHPIVPHQNSIFKAHNTIHLSENSIVTYGEIITCGRKHSGEIFLFKEFQNLTEIFYKERMILKDNILLEPGLMDVDAIGQLEGYTHQATLIHINDRIADTEEQVEYIYKYLAPKEDIIFGVSQSLKNGIVVRILGNGGEALFDIFKYIDEYLWKQNTSNQDIED